MRIVTAHTPDGFVVRKIEVDRESAWRWQPDGQIAVSHGSHGPWVIANKAIVPAIVLHLIAEESREQETEQADAALWSVLDA